jgi:hypothetical protein
MGGAFPGEFHRLRVGAVGDGKEKEVLPDFAMGQEGKKFRFLDQVRSPEKPVTGPPGPFNAESSSPQPLNLLPNGGSGGPQPPSDFLAGNESPLAFLEYPPEQLPHSSPVRENRMETFPLLSLSPTGKSTERWSG